MLKQMMTLWIKVNINDGGENLRVTELPNYTAKSLEMDVHEMIDDILGDNND